MNTFHSSLELNSSLTKLLHSGCWRQYLSLGIHFIKDAGSELDMKQVIQIISLTYTTIFEILLHTL